MTTPLYDASEEGLPLYDAALQVRLETFRRTVSMNLADGFTQVPDALLKDPALSASAKLVYEVLLSYMWSTDYCWPSQQTIADKLGRSRRTVIRALQELYERGYIERWRRGLTHTNIYFVNPLAFVHFSQRPDQRSIDDPSERLQELHTMPYREYLLTPEWQTRRKEQLKRSRYRCQVCNAHQVQLQVHHRTYERRGNEAFEDLITLCQQCHDLFHANGKLAKEDNT